MFCDESTSLLVKYHDCAVFRAVSDLPFLQPCVAIKYSRVENHSFRVDLIGNSIVLPLVEATNHFIQHNCVIFHQFHLAHESIKLNT
ncbi:MAG: hypothetical protein Q8S84_07235 [bacterium]|nr:hypothetical protein [bacterium]MDP3381248.1 hypothetical protein [bacterium]